MSVNIHRQCMLLVEFNKSVCILKMGGGYGSRPSFSGPSMGPSYGGGQDLSSMMMSTMGGAGSYGGPSGGAPSYGGPSGGAPSYGGASAGPAMASFGGAPAYGSTGISGLGSGGSAYGGSSGLGGMGGGGSSYGGSSGLGGMGGGGSSYGGSSGLGGSGGSSYGGPAGGYSAPAAARPAY